MRMVTRPPAFERGSADADLRGGLFRGDFGSHSGLRSKVDGVPGRMASEGALMSYDQCGP